MLAAALSLGYASPEKIERAIRDFPGLLHRASLVGKIGDVRFFDSSIDSTPERTKNTLSGMEGTPVLILGGRGKGLSADPLRQVFTQKCSGAVLLGETAEEMFAALSGERRPLLFADDMGDAVRKAFSLSEGAHDVLLSPAATSYDRYRNFEERGEDFARAVRDLMKEYDVRGDAPSK